MKKQQESLKNMVYQAILNGIFTDEYKPNQIINEQELVQKFGCSKTPIREALVTLCNEGILHSFPRFGYQVVSVSREEAQNIPPCSRGRISSSVDRTYHRRKSGGACRD